MVFDQKGVIKVLKHYMNGGPHYPELIEFNCGIDPSCYEKADNELMISRFAAAGHNVRCPGGRGCPLVLRGDNTDSDPDSRFLTLRTDKYGFKPPSRPFMDP